MSENEGAFSGRRSLRLQGYDYRTPGAYFVTICTYQRQLLFEGNGTADLIREVWTALPSHFSNIDVDAFVVMPNHVHGIAVIRADRVGAQHAAPLRGGAFVQPGSLGAIIRSFKSASTRELRMRGLHDATQVWQRNYYERIVRNEAELNRIREYIFANPAMWNRDPENLTRVPEPSYDAEWSWLEGP